MPLLPIIERELRVRARRPGFYRLRLAAALGAALLSLPVLVFGAGGLTSALGQGGRALFLGLVILCFVVCLLAGPLLAADCISSERSSGTLDLIFLTGIHGYELVAAKFVALTLPALQLLLAVLPVMALAFFLGGVSGAEFLRASGAVLTTLFLSLSISIACSAVFADGSKALGVSLALLLGWNVAVPVWELLRMNNLGLGGLPIINLPSPANALLLVDDAIAAANPGCYASAIWQGQLAGWSALAMAGAALPALWRRSLQRRLRQRPTAGTISRVGRPSDLHPLLWLARRQANHALGPWLLALLCAPALVACGWQTAQGKLPIPVALLAFASVQLVIKLWIAWSGSRGFAADRESGVLELLLVAPLDHRDVWRSRLAVLKRQFLGPVLLLAAMPLALMFFEASSLTGGDEWFWRASLFTLGILLLADAYTLRWVGLWQGLSARSATTACATAIFWVFVLPNLVTLVLGALMGGMMNGPPAVAVVFVIMAFVVGLLVDVAACVLAMIWVSDGFRAAAAGTTRTATDRRSQRGKLE